MINSRSNGLDMSANGLQTMWPDTEHARVILVQYGHVHSNPEGLCMRPMRGGVFCTMHKDHRGRHASVTYGCDGCHRRSRTPPFAYGPDGEYENGLQFCFMCASPQVNDKHGLGRELLY